MSELVFILLIIAVFIAIKLFSKAKESYWEHINLNTFGLSKSKSQSRIAAEANADKYFTETISKYPLNSTEAIIAILLKFRYLACPLDSDFKFSKTYNELMILQLWGEYRTRAYAECCLAKICLGFILTHDSIIQEQYVIGELGDKFSSLSYEERLKYEDKMTSFALANYKLANYIATSAKDLSNIEYAKHALIFTLPEQALKKETLSSVQYEISILKLFQDYLFFTCDNCINTLFYYGCRYDSTCLAVTDVNFKHIDLDHPCCIYFKAKTDKKQKAIGEEASVTSKSVNNTVLTEHDNTEQYPERRPVTQMKSKKKKKRSN